MKTKTSNYRKVSINIKLVLRQNTLKLIRKSGSRYGQKANISKAQQMRQKQQQRKEIIETYIVRQSVMQSVSQ